jgi:hypothetical protein
MLIRRRAVSSIFASPMMHDHRGDLVVERLQLMDNRRESIPHTSQDGTIALQNRCS